MIITFLNYMGVICALPSSFEDLFGLQNQRKIFNKLQISLFIDLFTH